MQDKIETDLVEIREMRSEPDAVTKLLESKNPYNSLKTSEALTNNIGILNQLDPEDLQELATRVVLDCPTMELAQYNLIVSSMLDGIEDEASTSNENATSASNEDAASTSNEDAASTSNEDAASTSNEDTVSTSNEDTVSTSNEDTVSTSNEDTVSNEDTENFLAKLKTALHVRNCVQKILDPNNLSTYSLLTDTDSFIEFNKLALPLIKGQENLFAERLVLITPFDDLSKLSRQLLPIFRNLDLTSQINKAILVRREIARFLLSDQPEKLLLNAEFNYIFFLEFPNLLNQLLKNEEEKIGTQLAEIKSPEVLIKIQSYLENLSHIDSFKLIAATLSSKKIEEKQISTDKKEIAVIDIQNASYSNTLFRRKKKSSNQDDCVNLDRQMPTEETLRDEGDEKSCCEKYCTLF